MAFTLGQMLGGWQKKGGKKNAPRPESESRSKRTRDAGSPQQISSRLTLKGSDAPQKSAEVRPSKTTAAKGESDLAWELITAPHISEKATLQGDNKYIFRVSDKATKGTIKRAIEQRYKVEVDSLNVLNMPGKKRRRGAVIGIKSGFKKAIVGLKVGQTISEF